MQIASQMAGFSLAEADILRGAMSKKVGSVFAKQKEKFIGGAKTNGIDKKTATRVFELVEHFAGYGFNKAHSTAYAVISYQTAYLKANYPVEFMAALLTSVMGNKDKVAQYVNECRRIKIEVLPPDVNESEGDFTAVGGAIRFGLSAVRNVGEGAIESIIDERKANGPFRSIYDFCRRVDLGLINKRALESLIKAGAFDFTGMSRRQLVTVFEHAVDSGLKDQRDKAIGQFTLFDVGQDAISQPVAVGLEMVDEYARAELLAYEKEMLGLYVSDHPLLEAEELLRAYTDHSLGELPDQKDGSVAWVGGIISKLTRITTKKGEPMLFINLEDLDGSVEAIIFPTLYDKYREILVEDKIIRVKGRIDLKEDGGPKLIALELELLDQKNKPATLCLSVSAESFSRQLLDELKAILSNRKGAVPVYLEIKNGNKLTKLALGHNYCVNLNDGLLGELKALLGQSAISLKQ